MSSLFSIIFFRFGKHEFNINITANINKRCLLCIWICQIINGTIWQEDQAYHAHNLALMLLSATGLLGTAAFAWLYVRVSKLALSDQSGFRAGMAAWPVVLLGIGLTGWNIYSSWGRCWLIGLSFLSLYYFRYCRCTDSQLASTLRIGQPTIFYQP